MHTTIRLTDPESSATAKLVEDHGPRRSGSTPPLFVHVELIGVGCRGTVVLTEAQGEQLRDHLVQCLGPGEPISNEPF